MGRRRGAARCAVWISLCCLGLAAAPANAAPGARRKSAVLPITRVRLYETGIGYFERSGSIRSGTRLPIPAAHLDDALKSLVILDAAKGSRLEGVHFDTRVTEQLGRALARLPTGADEPLDFEALTRSLIGAQVALHARGQTYGGRLLHVVSAEESEIETCVPGSVADAEASSAKAKADSAPPCVLRKQAAALLLRDTGELMRFGLLEIESLRALQPGAAERLRSAFVAHAGASSAQHELSVKGALSERVTLGYVAEAPLWRTTYRLVLSAKRPALQAWALLHNDSDEDWAGVKMELVNGQPDSFLFPLAAPRYARRRLVTPENELPSVPQLLERGADELWDMGDDGSIGHGGLGMSGYGRGAGGFSGRDAAVPAGETASSLLAIGDLAAHAEAVGEESGALFRYELAAPIDLPAHDSLLVPMLQEPVGAERVSYFEPESKVAQSALLFHNTTRQTLPAGTVAIFEDGGFGGESALERLKPGERRLLPFGVDLDVEIEHEPGARRETRRQVRFEEDVLIEHFERVADHRYELRNRSRSERSIHIELEVVNNAKVEQADALLVSGEGEVSAVFRVAGESVRKAQLRVTEGLERRSQLAQLTSAKLTAMASDPQLPREQRAVLEQAGRQLLERARRVARGAQLKAESERLQRKAERARKSLPLVARADPERGRALAAELVRTETRLAEAEREREALDPAAPLRAARATLARLGGTD